VVTRCATLGKKNLALSKNVGYGGRMAARILTEAPDSPLYRWRRAKGWTVEDVARKLRVSAATVCRWERGRRQPRERVAARLEKLTGGVVTAAEMRA
jgi:ribosome-binding protein aMBF1 (putative translation factor)